jgi:hypothetical protein
MSETGKKLDAPPCPKCGAKPFSSRKRLGDHISWVCGSHGTFGWSPVHESVYCLKAQLAALQSQLELERREKGELVALAFDALDNYELCGGQLDSYFQQKYRFHETLDELRERLVDLAPQGNPND